MSKKSKHTLFTCGILLGVAFFLLALTGCNPDTPPPTPTTSQLPTVEEIKAAQENYITEDEAKAKVLEYLKNYTPEQIEFEANPDGTTSDEADSDKDIGTITGVSLSLVTLDDDFHLKDDFCQPFEGQIECLNFADDAFYVFSLYNEYTTDKTTFSIPDAEYTDIQFHVNKLTGEVIELGVLKWMGNISTGTYAADNGNVIKITPDEENVLISFTDNSVASPTKFEGLAFKSAVENRYDLSIADEVITFIFEDDMLRVRSDGTSELVVALMGDYHQN